jgi:hypothetical protein
MYLLRTAVVPVQERVLAALGMIASYSDPSVVRHWGTPPQRVPTCFTGYYRQTLAEAGVLKLALVTQVMSAVPEATLNSTDICCPCAALFALVGVWAEKAKGSPE